jgi:hypothetical protein
MASRLYLPPPGPLRRRGTFAESRKRDSEEQRIDDERVELAVEEAAIDQELGGVDFLPASSTDMSEPDRSQLGRRRSKKPAVSANEPLTN